MKQASILLFSMKKYLALLLLSCLLPACRNTNSSTAETDEAVKNITSLEQIFPASADINLSISYKNDLSSYGNIEGFHVYKDYLIVVAYDTETGTWLHVYNKDSFELIKHELHSGRGPLDIDSHLWLTQLDRASGELTCYLDKKTMVTVYLDNVINDTKPLLEKTELFPFEMKGTIAMFRRKNGDYIQINRMEPSEKDDENALQRIMVYDEHGNLKSSYPMKFPFESERSIHALYEIDVSGYDYYPDEDLLFCSTFRTTHLESFGIGDEQIELKGSHRYFSELTDVLGFHGTCLAGGKLHAILDFSVLYSDFLSDKSKDEDLEKHIGVFDLDGNPIKLLNSSYRLEAMAIDGSDVYFVVYKEDGTYRLARLDN